MSRSILQENIYWNLFRVCMRAKHSMIQLADQHDLGLMQLYTLCSMDPGKSIPMYSISSMLSCDASNVTGITDRLVTRGLITREESPQDRRVKMIALTSEGVTLRQTILHSLKTYEPGLLENLTTQQTRELKDLIALIL